MSTKVESTQHLYVIKLSGITGTANRDLRGRLEHVASGRRHDFDSADALLDCLLHEEKQLVRAAVGNDSP